MVYTKMEEDKGGERKRGTPGKRQDEPQRTVAERQPIWAMMNADDAGIASPDRAKHIYMMMADIVPYRAFVWIKIVSESKAETMCLMTKRMDRATFVTEPTRQMYKQTATFVYIWVIVCENADLAVEINRCALLTNLRYARYGLPLFPVHRTAQAQSTDPQR